MRVLPPSERRPGEGIDLLGGVLLGLGVGGALLAATARAWRHHSARRTRRGGGYPWSPLYCWCFVGGLPRVHSCRELLHNGQFVARHS